MSYQGKNTRLDKPAEPGSVKIWLKIVFFFSRFVMYERNEMS